LDELKENTEKYAKQGEEYIAKPKKKPAPSEENEIEEINPILLKQRLCDLLLPRETPSAALRRLGKKPKKERKKKGRGGF